MREFVDKEGAIVTTTTITDEGLIEKRTQDVQPVLERNHEIATNGDGYTPSKDLKFVARIPLIVIEQWKKEGVDIYDPNCEAEIMRRLNNGSWAKLRTSGGRLEMAIGTFIDVKNAVVSALVRTDVPSYVYSLAQAEINNRLRVRAMERTVALTITSGEPYTAHPTGFLLARHAYIGSDGTLVASGGFDNEAFSDGFQTEIASGADVYRRLEQTTGFNQSTEFCDSGCPVTFSVLRDKFRWNPLPDDDYVAIMHGVFAPDEMTQDDDTNYVLVQFPSLYVYGALKHAAIWAQDTDIAQVYAAAFEGEVTRVTKMDKVSRMGGPLVARFG